MSEEKNRDKVVEAMKTLFGTVSERVEYKLFGFVIYQHIHVWENGDIRKPLEEEDKEIE